jgi:serum/glucocorticoid-regulated kinase 2
VGIDSFNLLKVLGRGAFGKVMLVEKKDSKEIYAMKSMRKEEIIDKEQIQHTKTEKQIMEHVNHPFLVNLAYAFQTPDKIFFVMQFMRGGELFQHLRHSKKFEESRWLFILIEKLSLP